MNIRRKTRDLYDDITNPASSYRRKTKKLDTYESLDFEEPDGDGLRLQFRKRTWRSRALADGLGYGLLVVIGISVGVIYLIMYVGVEIFAQWRSDYLKKYVLKQPNYLYAWLIAVGICLMFGLIGAFLVFFEPSGIKYYCAKTNFSGFKVLYTVYDLMYSGMPEVIAYLNGVNLKKHTHFRSLVFKFLALICLVSSGLFAGYDGPMALIGMIVAVLFINLIIKSSTASKYFFGDTQEIMMDDKDDIKNVLHVFHKKQSLVFAAAGSASGISAAFHSPLGGTVFALEEAVSFFNPALIIRTLFVCVITYFIVGYFGNLRSFDQPIITNLYALFQSDSSCSPKIATAEILSYIILGAFCGLIGAVYNKVVAFIVRVRIKYLGDRPYVRLLEVVAVCLLTSTVTVFAVMGRFSVCTSNLQAISHITPVSDKCLLDCSSAASFSFGADSQCFEEICLPSKGKSQYEKLYASSFAEVARQCPTNNQFRTQAVNIEKLAQEYELSDSMVKGDGCYYELPSLLFVSPMLYPIAKVLKNLFAKGQYYLFSADTLALFSVIYLIISVLTYNIMLPSDLVIPNLVFGASIGRLYGLLVLAIKIAVDGTQIDPASYALLGAAAFWSGTSRIMLTICVIMVETTLDLGYLLGIILSALTATIVGNWFGKSLFHIEMHLKRYPFLPHHCPPAINELKVMDIMTRSLVTLYESQTAKEIFMKLASCSHQGFPVIKEIPGAGLYTKKKLVGIILRSQLKDKFLVTVNVNETDQEILAGTLTKESAEKALAALRRAEDQNLTIDAQLKQSSSQTALNDDFSSQLEEDETLIDLTRIMNHPPFVVHHHMSLLKAYTMFRHLGLRHLCVVDDELCLVGILTRADFVWIFEKHEHHLHVEDIPDKGKMPLSPEKEHSQ